jgi:hypothetical protein
MTLAHEFQCEFGKSKCRTFVIRIYDFSDRDEFRLMVSMQLFSRAALPGVSSSIGSANYCPEEIAAAIASSFSLH